LTLIVLALVLYGPLYWVIRAAVRDGIRLAAQQDDQQHNAQGPRS
ncbi:MAG: hypothetical protein QOK10_2918, partial [Pseudonocardiales bacterium]|nr:hypothetical protein [Pseudonocardiales bacterium]